MSSRTVPLVGEAKRLGLVALGGVVGATLRYGFALAVPVDLEQGAHWPWATLIVNLVGALAIGVLVGILTRREANALGPFLITGVLGGFTTVSALAIEVVALFETGAVVVAGTYFVVTIAGGLAAVALGHRLAGDRV